MTIPFRRLLSTLMIVAAAAACSDDNPTGVTRTDLEGIWTGEFAEVTLLGRTLTGSVDWIFAGSTFELRFFDPPVNQAERISGNWKFAGGKLALTLTSSFPINSDVGATDTLFVSILGNELSLRTQGGSDILLQLSARSQAVNRVDPATPRRAGGPALHRPFAVRLRLPAWANVRRHPARA